ncbi:MAG: HD domain-containing protein [Chitinophagaceae bacterium]|nr:HD domain-containing protein [Chitinophagaceae bacterium]
MSFKGKIINDPIYGFIRISHPLVMQVVSHPWYQRLRRIHQMALASLVYPGAVHTRLHHSLGAYHLMGVALSELRRKGIEITDEEYTAAQIAILLHDIGHGPYSHALEGLLMPGIHHEQLSLLMMQTINDETEGALSMAIDIFTGKYPKAFLHQLVSGQLDVDRMDYLTRDSFFTGVSEGVIGYDRILTMLTVHEGRLMVEEKAIYSIEKFLVARRLMYWQAYLHKTVLVAEQMLVRIVERARAIKAECHGNLAAFLQKEGEVSPPDKELLNRFAQLDDVDIMMAIKQWRQHEDPVLNLLCGWLLDRKLLKIKLQTSPVDEGLLQEKRNDLRQFTGWDNELCQYLVFTGKAENTMYKTNDERIEILFKDGEVRDISTVDNALIRQNLAATVGKFYICWPADIS